MQIQPLSVPFNDCLARGPQSLYLANLLHLRLCCSCLLTPHSLHQTCRESNQNMNIASGLQKSGRITRYWTDFTPLIATHGDVCLEVYSDVIMSCFNLSLTDSLTLNTVA